MLALVSRKAKRAAAVIPGHQRRRHVARSTVHTRARSTRVLSGSRGHLGLPTRSAGLLLALVSRKLGRARTMVSSSQQRRRMARTAIQTRARSTGITSGSRRGPRLSSWRIGVLVALVSRKATRAATVVSGRQRRRHVARSTVQTRARSTRVIRGSRWRLGLTSRRVRLGLALLACKLGRTRTMESSS